MQVLDYHPFGTERLNEQTTDFDAHRKFAGHEFDDDIGLSYMLARYYNPSTGTFLSQDPAFVDLGDVSFKDRYQRSLEQHLQNPQALNSYAYALNNPLTYRDPQGEIVPLIIGAWMAIEFGLSVYDAYSTYKTLNDSNASGAEKAVSLGGFVAGLALPGGGYGTAGKQVVKHADDVAGAVKGIKAFDPVAQQQKMLRGIENSDVIKTIKDTFKTSDTIPGGTMGALRNEIMTGNLTKGKNHTNKAVNTFNRINRLFDNIGSRLNNTETKRLNGIRNSLDSLINKNHK